MTSNNYTAFTPSISILNTKQPVKLSSNFINHPLPKQTHHVSPNIRMVVAPPPPPTSTPNRLKERSVTAALRGLSDFGSVTVLHEIGARLAVGSSALGAGMADTQLLLGGLIGVWTAALFVRRSNWDQKTLIRESAALPNNWDSAVLYNPEIEEDEVVDAIAWLYALDELEGIAAAEMLQDLASSSNPNIRLNLVEALTEFTVYSNVCLSILHKLSKDESQIVRQAAEDALALYSYQSTTADTCTPVLRKVNSVSDEKLDEIDNIEAKVVLDKLFSRPDFSVRVEQMEREKQQLEEKQESNTKWMFDAMAKKMEGMSDIALSQPDFSQIYPGFMSLNSLQSTHEQDDCDEKQTSTRRFNVPLFESLRLSEVHGLFALALIPACYELLSLLDGADHPLRHVGLGWLMTMGGLIAYPGSGSIWIKFRKAITNETNQVR